MTLIKEIRISRFRSFFNERFECSAINIFSGANNAGKSNVLKALNLFFNAHTGFQQDYLYSVDYNKAYTESAGGKRAVEITLYFDGQGGGVLQKPFSITREFIEDSSPTPYIFHSTDEAVDKKIKDGNGSVLRQFRFFINRFQFIYIPAVRDRDFVRSIFLLLEKVVSTKKEEARYTKLLDDITARLSDRTKEIGIDFEKFINLPTKVETPTSIAEILEGLNIQTDPGIKVKVKNKKELREKFVGIYASGDGIIMTYLPHFLSFISRELKYKKFIWGFEEPENSLEYSKAQNLAKKIRDDFTKDVQIFITTHSPAFINLKDSEDVKLFRVYKDELDAKKLSHITDVSDLQESILEETKQLKLFIQEGNEAEVDKQKQIITILEKELGMIELSADIERYTVVQQKRKQDDIDLYVNQIAQLSKPIVFVEGPTDEIILRTAYNSLGGSGVFGDFEIVSTSKAGGGGKDQVFKFLTTHAHVHRSNKILGIFDCDKKGIEKYGELVFPEIQKGIKKITDGGKTMGGLLLTTDNDILSKYESEAIVGNAKICDFEIEDCFYDQFSNRFTQEVGLQRKKMRSNSKSSFANYIKDNSATINFSGLKPLFDAIKIALR